MRRNLDLLSVLFTMTRKNLTKKITALVPGGGGGGGGGGGSVVIDAILST